MEIAMRLPTAQEINPIPDNLDGMHALRNFLGKTLDEAEARFRENSIYYQEDLMFMGVVAFRFYVKALLNYIRSEAAEGDSDIINCLVGLLDLRFQFETKDELVPVASELAAICTYVLANFERFNVVPEVYGDLRPQFVELREKYSHLVDGRH
jgi:hypothetical protein